MQGFGSNQVTINIATSTIVKVLGFLVGLALIINAQRIIALVFISALMALAFAPTVRTIQRKWRFPRPLAVATIFVGLLLVGAGTILLLAGPLGSEVQHLSTNFTGYWQEASDRVAGWREYSALLGDREAVDRALSSVGTALQSAAGNIVAYLVGLLGGLLSLIMVGVLTFYLLLQEDAIRSAVIALSPPSAHDRVSGLIERLEFRLSSWLRGMVILCLVVGGLSLVGLSLLGVKYAVVLAIVAGVSELIPYVGPVLGAIPAIFLTLVTDTPAKAVAVIVLYWLIQQLENHLIVPKVMQHTVGLNPIVIIISVLLGAQLAGFAGVLVAVPTAAAVSVLLADWQSRRGVPPPPPTPPAS